MDGRIEVPVREHVEIAPYTTMRVGGTVRWLYRPESEDSLARLAASLAADGTPYFLAGGASNLLFRDEEFPGAVVLTGGVRELRVEDGRIVASCGVTLSALSRFALDAGKAGFSFAYGIPGTVGGGVYMNAGAYGGEIADVFVRAVCADRSGREVVLEKDDMAFAYRHSVLQENGLTLLRAVLAGPDGNREAIREEMERNLRARREKQPLEYPSCGSAFKRPPGNYAGALIERAGLKGFAVGGAQVSEKHAGFVINRGGATAANVRELLDRVRAAVYDDAGVWLEPEIQVLEYGKTES